MSRNTDGHRTEAEFEAMDAAFERGEFAPTGEAWLSPDVHDRLRSDDHVVSVPLSNDEQQELDSIAAASKMDRVDVVRAAVREYLASHGA
jgi:predicted transcriptional regulator